MSEDNENGVDEAKEADTAVSFKPLVKQKKRFTKQMVALLISGVGAAAIIGCIHYADKHVAVTDAAVVPAAIAHMPFPAKVIKSFDTKVPGIVGWTALANGQKSILYATRDGKYAFLGVMMGPDGTNQTAVDFKQYLPDVVIGGDQPAPQVDNDKALAAQLSILKSVAPAGLSVPGKSADRNLVIAVDLHCPYCHNLVSEINRLLEGKQSPVTITYAPVAILGPSSASAIGYLDAQPENMRLSLFSGWMEGKLGRDGASAFPSADATSVSKSTQHAAQTAQALQQVGFAAVPDIYWLENGQVKHIQGVPDEGTLKHLLGLDG